MKGEGGASSIWWFVWSALAICWLFTSCQEAGEIELTLMLFCCNMQRKWNLRGFIKITQTIRPNPKPDLPKALFLDSTRASQSLFTPAVFNLSFPPYLWPFHFWVPSYQSALSSCRLFFLNPAILLTFQFHSSYISLPLLSSWSRL